MSENADLQPHLPWPTSSNPGIVSWCYHPLLATGHSGRPRRLRVHVAAVRKALGDGREGNRCIGVDPAGPSEAVAVAGLLKLTQGYDKTPGAIPSS